MVQIIPKQEETAPLWIDFLFSLSVGFLVLCIGIFFLLNVLQKNVQESIALLDGSLAQERNQEFLSLERDMEGVKQRVEEFATLFKSRKDPLFVFSFLESTTHPRTFFKTLSFDVKTNEVHIDGIAETFRAVEEQLVIFRQNANVASVSLANLGFSSGGEISYQLTLSLAETLFLPEQ